MIHASCESVCVGGGVVRVHQDIQHKEMYHQVFSGNVCGRAGCVCFLAVGTYVPLRVVSAGTCHACILGKVSVCLTQGKARAWVCVCSHLHLGRDGHKYVCDHLQMGVIRVRKCGTVCVHACGFSANVWVRARVCVLMGRMWVRGQVMSNVCVGTAQCMPLQDSEGATPRCVQISGGQKPVRL